MPNAQTFCIGIAISASMLAVAAHGAAPTSQAKSAWQARKAAIMSFDYACATTLTYDPASNDPFFRQNQPQQVTEELELSFTMHAGKYAMSIWGNRWDPDFHDARLYRFRACSDGKEHKILTESGVLLAEEGVHAEPSIWRGDALHALWAGTFPDVVLAGFGCQVDHELTKVREVSIDGKSLIEFSMPRLHDGKVNPDWLLVMRVDPAVGYLPLEFRLEYKGKTASKHAVKYVPHDHIGWRIASWTSEEFNDEGVWLKTATGDVKSMAVNAAVSPAKLTIVYPAGTRITADDGKTPPKRYIQNSDGSRRRYNPRKDEQRPRNDAA